MLGGCWAVAGAGAAAAGYEYTNKQSLDRLDRDYKAGKISEQEYFRMKQEIENGSLVYRGTRGEESLGQGAALEQEEVFIFSIAFANYPIFGVFVIPIKNNPVNK